MYRSHWIVIDPLIYFDTKVDFTISNFGDDVQTKIVASEWYIISIMLNVPFSIKIIISRSSKLKFKILSKLRYKIISYWEFLSDTNLNEF